MTRGLTTRRPVTDRPVATSLVPLAALFDTVLWGEPLMMARKVSSFVQGRWRLVGAILLVAIASLACSRPPDAVGSSPAPASERIDATPSASTETAAIASTTAPSSAPTSAIRSPLPQPREAASPTPTSTSQAGPSWATGLLGQLQCDGVPASIGGEVGEISGDILSPISAEAALAAFTSTTSYTAFPLRGYEPTQLDRDWAQFSYMSAGKTKALVVVRRGGPLVDTDAWTLAGLRACDPAEFAPGSGFTGALLAVWLDANEARVPTTTLSETHGASHCDWESVTWLRLDGVSYLRDPLDRLEFELIVPFEPDATLPDGARSTGYHEGGRTIWQADDPSVIYVVTEDGVERWPQPADQIGCM